MQAEVGVKSCESSKGYGTKKWAVIRVMPVMVVSIMYVGSYKYLVSSGHWDTILRLVTIASYSYTASRRYSALQK